MGKPAELARRPQKDAFDVSGANSAVCPTLARRFSLLQSFAIDNLLACSGKVAQGTLKLPFVIANFHLGLDRRFGYGSPNLRSPSMPELSVL